MPRRSRHVSIDEIIALEVRRTLGRRALAAARATATPRRARARAAAPRAARPRPAPPPAAAPEPTPVAAPAASHGTSSDNVDRVRKEFALAYEGQPVSADRLAFRMKADRVLVDAALTYLVTRKEARMTAVRGKVGYMPLRPR